jgi:hypothetical protein
MIKWKTDLINKLDNKQGNVDWGEVGSQLLQTMYIENPSIYEDYNIFNGLDNLYPVNWDNCVTEFIDKPYDNYK